MRMKDETNTGISASSQSMSSGSSISHSQPASERGSKKGAARHARFGKMRKKKSENRPVHGTILD